jgi:hypothetical protein
VPLSPSSILAPAPDVRFRIVGDEAVVVLQGSARVMGLNPVGSRCLALLDGRSSVADLLDRLHDELGVERHRLHRDVVPFLEQLHEHGVIREVGDRQ